MKKTVIEPGTWRDTDSDELDEPQSAYATVTHRDGYKHVAFSGATYPEGDIEEQVRTILEHRRNALRDLGGSMDDITAMRLYVVSDSLDRTMQTRPRGPC